ncbi:MAG TPA: hypothetical protein VLR69_11045 [Thermoanaerobaculia bacterium]|nr:hypothetical protein [Thermoanaerobaculia bacterium]
MAFAGRLVEAPVTIYLPANVPPAKAAKLEAAPFFSRLRVPLFRAAATFKTRTFSQAENKDPGARVGGCFTLLSFFVRAEGVL